MSEGPANSQALPAAAVCLVVLDGWGLGPDGPGNAVALANTPVFDSLWQRYPHTQLTACGRAVGLPDGQMGNSEVGHLNLGAGAIVRQDLTRIDDAMADGTFEDNPVIGDAFRNAPRIHLIGLVSDGGVHSSLEQLGELIALAGRVSQSEVIVHAFTDGRDTLPHNGAGYLQRVSEWCKAAPNARVATIVGRYFAMDRDRRWDRVEIAYNLLAHGRGEHHYATVDEAIAAAYARGESDEFVRPTTVGDDARIAPEDSVFCFNFRPDRMREIVRALAQPDFDGFDREGGDCVARLATMTVYEDDFPYPVAFLPDRPSVTLTTVVADAGRRQLHVAETEKYAHVTYFFNGGQEAMVAGEEREVVASARDVATYDLRPQMSAAAAAEVLVERWREYQPAFAIINFANPDMVGHTGVIPAAVTAIETVDTCLGAVCAAVEETGGVCVITADHGNADHMLEPDGSPNTAHSLNPVPLIVTVAGLALRDRGILADVAPTVLELLAIEQPSEMTGQSLIG